MRDKRATKPKKNFRKEFSVIRFLENEKEEFEALAERAGLKLSPYLRHLVVTHPKFVDRDRK